MGKASVTQRARLAREHGLPAAPPRIHRRPDDRWTGLGLVVVGVERAHFPGGP
jgi:hypothetical protein